MTTSHSEAYAYPLLVKQLLHSSLHQAAEQEIVYRDVLRYNYRSLGQRIARLAHGLRSLGVQAGQTVAVMDWDSHRYLECFFAVPMMGAVLQTVNVRLSAEQISYTLAHAEAEVLLVNADFLSLLKDILPQLPRLKSLILLHDEDQAITQQLPFAAEYEALLQAQASSYDFPDFDENTRATLFYTTGTTGAPKGVFFSHRQLVLHTLAACAGLAMPATQGRLHKADVYMPLTPMFHVHAWGLPYVATMMGIKQVYPGRYAPDTLLQLIAREKVSFSHCVPTILHMLLQSPLCAEVDLRNWKVIIGGAQMTPALARAALQLGIDVFTGYGMSETCPILSLAHLPAGLDDEDLALELRCKTGLPIPLVDLRVVDEHMQSLPVGEVGEVVARTPWLTQAYLHDANASAQLWRGGFLHTNDLGKFDQRGYLQVTDRLKDVIKSGGEWISSLSLENIISQHASVAEVAVIAIKDQRWGERPLALVVSKAQVIHATAADAVADADSIKQHIVRFAEQGHISRYGVPDQVLFVSALAKTSVGKLDKKAMRLQYEALAA